MISHEKSVSTLQFPVNKVIIEVRTMLRSPLPVIGHVLTIDVIGLVEKMVGGIKNTDSYTRRSLPF